MKVITIEREGKRVTVTKPISPEQADSMMKWMKQLPFSMGRNPRIEEAA